MAVLIDRGKLVDYIMESYPDWCVKPVRPIFDFINGMPSAEPKIIRCEYCAHRNQYRFPPKYEVRDYCEVHEKVTTLTNFCSWAERRQDG